MTYLRAGLGAVAPASYYTTDANGNKLPTAALINQVIMPDGSVIPLSAFLALPAAAWLLAPSGAARLAEIQNHVAQNAWYFTASQAGGSTDLTLSYNSTNFAPATGSITVVGGAGNPAGGVSPISGTITSTGYVADQGTAPLATPVQAPAPATAISLNPSLIVPLIPPAASDKSTTPASQQAGLSVLPPVDDQGEPVDLGQGFVAPTEANAGAGGFALPSWAPWAALGAVALLLLTRRKQP